MVFQLPWHYTYTTSASIKHTMDTYKHCQQRHSCPKIKSRVCHIFFSCSIIKPPLYGAFFLPSAYSKLLKITHLANKLIGIPTRSLPNCVTSCFKTLTITHDLDPDSKTTLPPTPSQRRYRLPMCRKALFLQALNK